MGTFDCADFPCPLNGFGALSSHTKGVFRGYENVAESFLSMPKQILQIPEIDLVGLKIEAIWHLQSSDAGIRKPQPEFLLEVWKTTSWTLKTVMVGEWHDSRCCPSIRMEVSWSNTFPYSDAELREKNQAGVRGDSRYSRIAEDWKISSVREAKSPPFFFFHEKCYSRGLGFVKFSLSWYTMELLTRRNKKDNRKLSRQLWIRLWRWSS